jgi:hypothetical protein
MSDKQFPGSLQTIDKVSNKVLNFHISLFTLILRPKGICIHKPPPNGLRYPRWGGDGEAVQLEK